MTLSSFEKFQKYKKKKYNPIRAQLHKNTKHFLYEARRAMGYAMMALAMKQRDEYCDWLDNVLWLLIEADVCRQKALKEPWRK